MIVTPASVNAKIVDKTPAPGSSIFISNDLRLDAGEKFDGKQNVYLQVNEEAEAVPLKKWVNKNGRGTHGNLAQGSFDTGATDLAAEYSRMVEDLDSQAKDKIG